MTRLSHHAKSKVGRRRSQLSLRRATLVPCPNCKGPTAPHRICPACGTYERQPKRKREQKT